MNGTKVNPDFEFEPLPEPLNGCNQGYCFCKIVGGKVEDHKCPWDLNDFPGNFLDIQREASASCAGTPSVSCSNWTTCDGETSGKIGGAGRVYIGQTITTCGSFLYIQPDQADNYYSKHSDIVKCPIAWAGVEVVGDGESGATEPSFDFLFKLLLLSMGIFACFP